MEATFMDRIEAGVKFKYEGLLPAAFATSPQDQRALITATISAAPDGGDPGADLIVATADGVRLIPNLHNGDFVYCETSRGSDEGLFDEEGFCRVLVNRMFDEPISIDLAVPCNSSQVSTSMAMATVT